MRRIWEQVSLIVLFTSLSSAQVGETARDQSNIEKFSAKAGSLIEKRFVKVGYVGNLDIEVLHITDLLAGSRVSGLRLSMAVSSSYSTDTKVAFLDDDETDALTKVFNKVSAVAQSSPSDYTEIQFTSRGGFQFGCFYDLGWRHYVRLEKYDSKSFRELSIEELTKFKNLIWDGKKQFSQVPQK